MVSKLMGDGATQEDRLILLRHMGDCQDRSKMERRLMKVCAYLIHRLDKLAAQVEKWHGISEEKEATIEQAQKCLQTGTIMAFAPYSSNPADNYLAVVLVQLGYSDFVVWTFNSVSNGFANGSYSQSLRVGLEAFKARLHV